MRLSETNGRRRGKGTPPPLGVARGIQAVPFTPTFFHIPAVIEKTASCRKNRMTTRESFSRHPRRAILHLSQFSAAKPESSRLASFRRLCENSPYVIFPLRDGSVHPTPSVPSVLLLRHLPVRGFKDTILGEKPRDTGDGKRQSKIETLVPEFVSPSAALSFMSPTSSAHLLRSIAGTPPPG